MAPQQYTGSNEGPLIVRWQREDALGGLLSDMSVTVHQRPLEATRTLNKSCKWVAETIVDGRTYMAVFRIASL